MKEAVNHPEHYGGKDNPYEAIKVIRAWELDFELGNVVKYISRAGKKDKSKEIEDLKKAVKYLEMAIEYRENKEEWHNWDSAKKDNDPIKIDWSKIHTQYSYVARDADGLWCAYINEPVIDTYRNNRWECLKSQFDYTGLGYYAQVSCILSPQKINWKETLRKRP